MTSACTRCNMMRSHESQYCNAMRGDIEGGGRGGQVFQNAEMRKG